MRNMTANPCVQATLDCALLVIFAQVSGSPDAERWESVVVIPRRCEKGMRGSCGWPSSSWMLR